jgi:hypothetical protein
MIRGIRGWGVDGNHEAVAIVLITMTSKVQQACKQAGRRDNVKDKFISI